MEVLKKIFNTPIYAYWFIGLVCSYFIYLAFSFEPHDFSNYYFGATFLKDNTFDTSIYFPHHFNLDIAALGYEHIYTSYAPHNPFLALFFTPFTFFSLTTAKIIFNIIGLGLFLFSLRNLVKMYPIKAFYLFLIPLLFFVPLKNNFLFGQAYLWLFFLLTEGFLAYKKERYIRMGIFWGFAILLKVIPIVLVALLFFKKKYKAIFIMGAVGLVLFAFSVMISGVDNWLFYFTHVLSKSGSGEITTEFVQNYQSMFMLLKGYFMSNDSVFGLVLLFFKLFLLFIGFSISIKEKSHYKIFTYWIFISILLTPTGSTYIGVLFIFPFIYFANKRRVIKEKVMSYGWFAILASVLLISNLPIPYFKDFPLPFSFPRLILILFFFIYFIKENLAILHWKVGAIVILPLVILSFFLQKKDIPSDFALLSNAPLLTYDYKVIDGQLLYIHWGLDGEEISNSEIAVSLLDTSSVYIKEEQLFLNDRQLTFDKSNKMKPAIVNDTLVIFLSDYKRGIGFYELRGVSVDFLVD